MKAEDDEERNGLAIELAEVFSSQLWNRSELISSCSHFSNNLFWVAVAGLCFSESECPNFRGILV